jgi:hypothetical protein
MSTAFTWRRRHDYVGSALLAILWVGASISYSYMMALVLKEPHALWLWRDILGVL